MIVKKQGTASPYQNMSVSMTGHTDETNNIGPINIQNVLDHQRAGDDQSTTC